MLKTSPILNSSANTSPTSFRHAPSSWTAPPSAESSVPASTSVQRRPASRSASSVSGSMKSPQSFRSSRQQTITVNSEDAASRSASSVSMPIEPPPAPRPEPSEKTSATLAASTSASPATTSAPESAVEALSPNKRRGSPAEKPQEAPLQNLEPDPTAESSAQASKRAKPEEHPPKILPIRYELCDVEDMVVLIAHMLAELIATNDAIRISNGGLTRFHSRTAPGISVQDYLHRLAKHATLTPPLLLAMVYYIDRLCALYQEFTINTLTVHRFLITAATVAAKGLSDSFWNNTTYARVGGVRVAELKLLELEFLYRVDWKIVPNPEVLVAYYRGLVERTPGYALESNAFSEEEELDGEDEEEDEADGSD